MRKCAHSGISRHRASGSSGLKARSFVDTVPAPKHGEMVPEAILYAFELAHDLLERDHPQMRAALLWFGDEILAKHQINFMCCMPDGDVRVGLSKDVSS